MFIVPVNPFKVTESLFDAFVSLFIKIFLDVNVPPVLLLITLKLLSVPFVSFIKLLVFVILP